MFANKHECECPNCMIVDTFGYAFRPHIVDSDMLFHVPKPFWKGHHHFGVMIWIFVLRLWESEQTKSWNVGHNVTIKLLALIRHDLNVRRNLEFWESRGALSTQLADFLRWLKIVFCVGRRCATCCDPAAWQSRPHNNAPQRSPILIIICLYTKKQICNLRPSCKSKRYFDNLVAAFVSQSMSAIFFASELSKRSVSNSGNALCSLKSLHRAIAGFIFD